MWDKFATRGRYSGCGHCILKFDGAISIYLWTVWALVVFLGCISEGHQATGSTSATATARVPLFSNESLPVSLVLLPLALPADF
jgi:hypothetical protein